MEPTPPYSPYSPHEGSAGDDPQVFPLYVGEEPLPDTSGHAALCMEAAEVLSAGIQRQNQLAQECEDAAARTLRRGGFGYAAEVKALTQAASAARGAAGRALRQLLEVTMEARLAQRAARAGPTESVLVLDVKGEGARAKV